MSWTDLYFAIQVLGPLTLFGLLGIIGAINAWRNR